MKVPVKNIPPGGRDLSDEVPFADLGIEGADWVAQGPVYVRARATKSHEEVTVRGRLAVELQVECCRCLSPCVHEVSSDFEVYFEPCPEPLAPDEPLPPGPSLGMEYYTGHVVDLTSTLRDALVLAVPSRLLCRPDCAGLCPRCGADRNEGPCRCTPSPEEAGEGQRADATEANPFARFFRERASPEELGRGGR
ncbi:MAG: DUF177 domain-containing protein [Planctomycetes bacterium]|nr:DUF177 domain-containing protein [Planctomycetota bacterium]